MILYSFPTPPICRHSDISSSTPIFTTSARVTMSIDDFLYSHNDYIIPLPHHVVINMIENQIDVLPLDGLYYSSIPSRTRRIWVYEEDMEGITIMITLNRYTLPNRLYYITNPLYSEIMERRYHFPRNLIPSFAPRRIRRRFRGHLHHIW